MRPDICRSQHGCEDVLKDAIECMSTVNKKRKPKESKEVLGDIVLVTVTPSPEIARILCILKSSFNSHISNADCVGEYRERFIKSLLLHHLDLEFLFADMPKTIYEVLPYLLCAFLFNMRASHIVPGQEEHAETKSSYELFAKEIYPDVEFNNYYGNLNRFMGLFSLERWYSEKRKQLPHTNITLLRESMLLFLLYSNCVLA